MSWGREAISFLFNVKTFSFVVLSVDIKVFPLPHYAQSFPSNPTPYWLPMGVFPLNLLSHPPIHPWFWSLYTTGVPAWDLIPVSFQMGAHVDLSNPTILSRRTIYPTDIPWMCTVYKLKFWLTWELHCNIGGCSVKGSNGCQLDQIRSGQSVEIKLKLTIKILFGFGLVKSQSKSF